MPAPAADPTPAAGTGKAAGRLAWLAGAACVACCALPALVAAGLLGGAAAGAAAWMPTAAIVLAVASVVVFAAGHLRARHRTTGHGCAAGASGCTEQSAGTVDLDAPSVRSRL